MKDVLIWSGGRMRYRSKFTKLIAIACPQVRAVGGQDKEFNSVKEVAEFFECSTENIIQIIKRGGLCKGFSIDVLEETREW